MPQVRSNQTNNYAARVARLSLSETFIGDQTKLASYSPAIFLIRGVTSMILNHPPEKKNNLEEFAV